MRKSITFTPAELHLVISAMLNPNYNLKVSVKDEDRLWFLAKRFEQVHRQRYPKYRLTWETKKKLNKDAH